MNRVVQVNMLFLYIHAKIQRQKIPCPIANFIDYLFCYPTQLLDNSNVTFFLPYLASIIHLGTKVVNCFDVGYIYIFTKIYDLCIIDGFV
jgi:hypothetical protein